MIERGKFPKQFMLSKRAVGWHSDQILVWQNSRPEAWLIHDEIDELVKVMTAYHLPGLLNLSLLIRGSFPLKFNYFLYRSFADITCNPARRHTGLALSRRRDVRPHYHRYYIRMPLGLRLGSYSGFQAYVWDCENLFSSSAGHAVGACPP